MRRRALLAGGGAWLATVAASALAQVPKPPRRVAVLIPGTQAGFRARLEAFRGELQRLGHVEGRGIVIVVRHAEDKTERLVPLAAELVALKPAVIMTSTSAGTAACKKATATIPIVFATGGRPVEQGFVESLRRPGGNVTGVITANPDFTVKVVELTREALPQAKRIAILVHESDPAHKSIQEYFVSAARRFKFDPLIVPVASSADLDRAFTELVRQKADALYLANLGFNVSHLRELVERASKAKVALVSQYINEIGVAGVLSYGTEREENFRRAAALVDKILRGANPAELPVEQPMRFQLVVNQKTAKAIGAALSPAIMLRADRVIE